MSVRRDFPDIPPVWALATLAVQAIAAFLLPVVPLEGAVVTALGWLAIASGLGLVGWSAFWFWRKRTSIEPRDTPARLIVEGPFRLNRNPIYTGIALVLLGCGLLLGALSSVLLAALFPLVITRRFVRAEEVALRAAFGPEAEGYIARSRRW